MTKRTPGERAVKTRDIVASMHLATLRWPSKQVSARAANGIGSIGLTLLLLAPVGCAREAADAVAQGVARGFEGAIAQKSARAGIDAEVAAARDQLMQPFRREIRLPTNGGSDFQRQDLNVMRSSGPANDSTAGVDFEIPDVAKPATAAKANPYFADIAASIPRSLGCLTITKKVICAFVPSFIWTSMKFADKITDTTFDCAAKPYLEVGLSELLDTAKHVHNAYKIERCAPLAR